MVESSSLAQYALADADTRFESIPPAVPQPPNGQRVLQVGAAESRAKARSRANSSRATGHNAGPISLFVLLVVPLGIILGRSHG